FDIIGGYRLAQIETDLGADNIGTEVALLGTGIQHNYARNYLFSNVYNIHHKGGIELQTDNESTHFIQWGLKYQREEFDDLIHEWERLDSAGYSLPYDENEVQLRNFVRSENVIDNSRYEFYLQNSYTSIKQDNRELKMTGGVRVKYSQLNEELIVSPRFQLLYKPSGGESSVAYKLAGGVYYQSPFYREMRRLDGTLNPDLKSQRSLHLVGGISYDFIWEKISKKPFRLISEIYYKKLDNLISYDLDNVKIRYSGENDASGSVIGWDIRVNGEFVPGAESWVNLSILSARENLTDIQHMRRERGETEGREVNSVPRPTDRLFNLSMYFQDYLPRNENFKVNLNLSLGAGLPFGLRENNDVYRNTYRFKSYHRIDIGFSYQLWSEGHEKRARSNPFSFTRNAWVSLEVFNLMDISNVASNTWIKTITNTQYAIPNFLTSRRINLRLRMDL
ncbi:MAG: TonB-dependent receptor, partial [Saprospiraceae bacterium]|nr:TonB-dependent receptor [Saprospiraceae bacterium]